MDRGPDPLDALILEEEMAFIKKAINHLPPACRAVCQRKLLLDETIGEIASDLGIEANTCRAHYNIGRKRLMQSLAILENQC